MSRGAPGTPTFTIARAGEEHLATEHGKRRPSIRRREPRSSRRKVENWPSRGVTLAEAATPVAWICRPTRMGDCARQDAVTTLRAMKIRVLLFVLVTLSVLGVFNGLADSSEPLRLLLSAAVAIILIGGLISALVTVPRMVRAFQGGIQDENSGKG
jgi:hypothetical protein